MAIRSQSGYILASPENNEPEKSITQKSIEAGLGVPNQQANTVPVGSTQEQVAQIGTPNQQQNAQKTLSERSRYTQKPLGPTEEQQRTIDRAASLKELGPVRTRVQSMLDQRISDITQSKIAAQDFAQLQLDQEKLGTLDSDKQQLIKNAWSQFQADKNQESFSQQMFNILGGAGVESGGIGGYLTGSDEIISQLGQTQLAGAGTVGTLFQPDEIAQIEAIIPGASGMTLAQLETKIVEFEAQELSRGEQIQAQLEDPNLSAQMREQLLTEYAQYASSGLIASKEAVDQLEEQISQANTIVIGGIEMSLADALGDEGISQTIKQAVVDPSRLENLEKIPGYRGLADWIKTNKSSLELLVGELSQAGDDFVKIQEQYEGVKRDFDTDLLGDILGQDFHGKTVTAQQWQEISAKMQINPVYQYMKSQADQTFRDDMTRDPGFRGSVLKLAAAGMPLGEIDELMDDLSEFKNNDKFSKLMGSINARPTTLAEAKEFSNKIAQFNELDPFMLQDTTVSELIDNGTLSFTLMKQLGESEFAPQIIKNLGDQMAFRQEMNYQVQTGEDPLDVFKKNIFGTTDFSAGDLNAVLESGATPQETRDLITKIFNSDSDNQISVSEFNDPEAAARAAGLAGVNQNPETLISGAGKFKMPTAQVDVSQAATKKMTQDIQNWKNRPEFKTTIQNKEDQLVKQWDSSLPKGVDIKPEQLPTIKKMIERLPEGTPEKFKQLNVLQNKLDLAKRNTETLIDSQILNEGRTPIEFEIVSELSRELGKLKKELVTELEPLRGLEQLNTGIKLDNLSDVQYFLEQTMPRLEKSSTDRQNWENQKQQLGNIINQDLTNKSESQLSEIMNSLEGWGK